ncbi:tRNA (guanosine(46)-N7)-methyltransferase TrmB [Isachenkonia alkalipeptolytica]|uniref:tRNA (guanine-N(7)-)-methyltransferase n=1 Tax=Isachenkonia alkalipeptolytica TaxID=2565777 RepID=A0AA43XI58_9CLOT|nr:tRNA (guanosine(46)-N7)-methyltransferase TrmB [Isachenkonia alkalipeptolytica]NBG87242.1 tRNA (guanosine(46)-N7)-methyltransferase TrmB [Isachenkonia alkalipeptolytica]
MRRRRLKDGVERLLAHRDWLVEAPEQLSGQWDKLTGGKRIHLEIGMGKGQFITTLAEENPDVFYLGLEIKEEVLLRGVEKAIEKELDNVRFLWKNAEHLDQYFAKEEVERIYLNFSDPWPKSRTAKRRLTHQRFLNKYRKILVKEGEIHVKTDNEKLFEFSLNALSDEGYRLKNITFDYHNSGLSVPATTEYEDKFSRSGLRIYRLEAIKRD